MTKKELLELLRDNLKVEIDYSTSFGYYDTTTLTVKIMFDDEVISESVTYPPDFEPRRDNY